MYIELLLKEIHYLSKIPLDRIEFFVELLYSGISKNSRIICSGMGKAGQIAHTFSTTLSSTGTPSYFLHPSEAQHGDLGIICSDDILIVFSNSGKTREVLELIDLSKNLHPDLRILCIVGESNEEIESKTSLVLQFGPVEEICPLGLTPTTSTTCMSVICDLIVVGLMNKNNFTKEEYAKRHHGGYLGKKSKS
jgi:arabinose-5-phosphate isomerase